MNIINSMLATGTPAAAGFPWQMAVIMVGFLAFFYFFVIRPQNKKKKDAELMLKALKKGDKVVSIGGIHGKIVSVKENEIVIKVDSNAEITFDKSAISKATGTNSTTGTQAALDKEKS